MKSLKKPTHEQIQRVASKLQTAEHVRYFFQGLQNPAWIEPLEAAGYFKRSPEPIREGEYIRFPPWAQSQYLARMAGEAPEGVLALIKDIKTTNPVIQSDFIDATLRMPAEYAAQLIPVVTGWLSQEYFRLPPDRLGDLVQHLIEGGEAEAAFSLADPLLAVQVDPRTVGRDTAISFGPRASSRLETWDYERLLERTLSALVRIDPLRALHLVCDKLLKALEIEGIRDGDDFSSIWLEYLTSKQTSGEIKSVLGIAVRQTGDKLVGYAPTLVCDAVTLLEAYGFSIFYRVATHLIMKADSINLARSRLTSTDYLCKSGIRRERDALLRSFFGRLHEGEQERIAQFLTREPDTAHFGQWYEEVHAKPPPVDEVEKYKREVWLKELSPIGDQLKGKWDDLYKGLIIEFGEPKPEGPIISSYVGPTSPLAKEQLLAMGPGEVIQHLRDWRPRRERWSPSPRGLGRELAEVVAEAPDRFLAKSEELRLGIHPTYLSHLIAGLRSAIAKEKTLDWSATLSLLLYVTHHDRFEVAPSIEVADRFDIDQTWESARLNAAHLLEAALSKNDVPFTLRKEVWQALEPLLADPDPTPEYEAEYGGENMEPFTLAINSVRGEAMHALLQYALWCARHLRPDDARLAAGPILDELPEVYRILEEKLDPSSEPSLSVRSVYGRFFPWLALLSRPWAQAAVGRIFPPGEAQCDLRLAAWESYLTFCNFYYPVYTLLEGEYRRAVTELSDTSKKPDKRVDPHRRLTEHIGVLYLLGHSPIGREDSLLQEFFSRATPFLRAELISFIGRWMEKWTERPSDEIIERLMHLWELRLEVLRDAPPGERQEELAEFGWWFIWDVLPTDWLVKSLLLTVKLTEGHIEGEFKLLPKLATIGEQLPYECVAILSAMIDSVSSALDLYQIRRYAKPILEFALRGGKDAQTEAVAANDKFMKRGIHDYRELFG